MQKRNFSNQSLQNLKKELEAIRDAERHGTLYPPRDERPLPEVWEASKRETAEFGELLRRSAGSSESERAR
jgi:hypothetical protein